MSFVVLIREFILRHQSKAHKHCRNQETKYPNSLQAHSIRFNALLQCVAHVEEFPGEESQQVAVRAPGLIRHLLLQTDYSDQGLQLSSSVELDAN